MRVLILALALGVCLAFVPAAPSARRATALEASQSRRDAGAALLGAASLFAAGLPAFAKAGQSPTQSYFGLIGSTGAASENAAYGTDQTESGAKVWSAYGPYSAIGNGAYTPGGADELSFKKKLLVENEKRVAKAIDYINAKKWIEVRMEFERQTYSMRNNMNTLAKGNADATKAAKAFYVQLENVDLAAKRKQGDIAAASYDKMMAALDNYNKLVGI